MILNSWIAKMSKQWTCTLYYVISYVRHWLMSNCWCYVTHTDCEIYYLIPFKPTAACTMPERNPLRPCLGVSATTRCHRAEVEDRYAGRTDLLIRWPVKFRYYLKFHDIVCYHLQTSTGARTIYDHAREISKKKSSSALVAIRLYTLVEYTTIDNEILQKRL